MHTSICRAVRYETPRANAAHKVTCSDIFVCSAVLSIWGRRGRPLQPKYLLAATIHYYGQKRQSILVRLSVQRVSAVASILS